MCERFLENLSDHELSLVLVHRHRISEEVAGVSLALEAIDAERARLREVVAKLESEDPLAHRIIAQFLLSELPERPRR